MIKCTCDNCRVYPFCTDQNCARWAKIETDNVCTLTENDLPKLKRKIVFANKVGTIAKIEALVQLGIPRRDGLALVRSWEAQTGE